MGKTLLLLVAIGIIFFTSKSSAREIDDQSGVFNDSNYIPFMCMIQDNWWFQRRNHKNFTRKNGTEE